ncbi:MAG: GNAT family N-acetyltransferase [Gammaproteobacteria bacterium]|nr:GNAT family N-acetyltransferase [Gammaproteobacteria bacterium]MCK5262460.1 GNAT family N-acetyltransferase [Gammaproteobacteria bacterium]
MIDNIQFITTNWKHSHQALKQIRTCVFIEEQHVPAELEWDEFDAQSIHFLVLHDNNPIATARLKPDGQIGRMAVIKNYRHKGIGTELLTTVLLQAKINGYSMVYLHAQKQAIDFYKQFHFIYNGSEFMDAGITHRAMYKLLNNNNKD